MQHVGQGFPLDWFTHTFNKLSVAMGALAIAVGPLATVAHDLAGGNVGPFKLSLVIVAVNGLQVIGWRRDANKSCPTFAATGRLVSRAWSAVSGPGGSQVAKIAAAQGLFEATMFGFALLWTPLLNSAAYYPTSATPWGLAFAQLLGCVMIGSVSFKLITALYSGATAERMCVWACAMGFLCFCGLTWAIFMKLPGIQLFLMGFELCVGVYLNGMGVIRSKYVPQEVSLTVKGFAVRKREMYQSREKYSRVPTQEGFDADAILLCVSPLPSESEVKCHMTTACKLMSTPPESDQNCCAQIRTVAFSSGYVSPG